MKILTFVFCCIIILNYADEQKTDNKIYPFTLEKNEIPKGHTLVKFSENDKKQGLKNPGFIPQKFLKDFCTRLKIEPENIHRIYNVSLKGKSDQAGYMAFEFSDKQLLDKHLEKVLKMVVGWVFIYSHKEHLLLFWSHDSESVPILQQWAGHVVKRLKSKDEVNVLFRGKRYIPPAF
ncbi:hypothetical protein [Candidatus Uabimicrobium amorphum]|uniref:Uncharacterized protein n=1 Tax=Uabimicrobium amorphum TaxID=2596890 RepID=A0A5S9IJ17_UABAM|nr:hypothetical protein [Candidatus Uabimicrobium amorphum]BBM82758.1 hypothetical protein UABAM_01101 [Candidatus Uabimicrobium amorphum]